MFFGAVVRRTGVQGAAGGRGDGSAGTSVPGLLDWLELLCQSCSRNRTRVTPMDVLTSEEGPSIGRGCRTPPVSSPEAFPPHIRDPLRGTALLGGRNIFRYHNMCPARRIVRPQAHTGVPRRLRRERSNLSPQESAAEAHS